MAETLPGSAATDIRKAIDTVTSDPKRLPGCVIATVGKDGKPIFTHASGTIGIDTKEPMTMETIFWIASCTKMIGGIAAMQLVEQGKLSLDDADQVEKICPELKDIKILKGIDAHGKPELVAKKNRITLRMLLSHTAGFGYTFFNHELRKWGQPIGYDELSGYAHDVEDLPLVAEPGTAWQYGVNIDWAGSIVSRASGLSLNDYFQKHIFAPLSITNISMFPTAQMKSRLAHMHQRDPATGLRARDHMLRRPLICPPTGIADVYNSAGAGCFAPPLEYCRILAVLLNNGTSPTTGAQILKPETVDAMFENQIPEHPDFARQGIPAAKPDYTNPLPELYPAPREHAQGWGLTFMLGLHDGATGRRKGTAHWAGLPNLFWWCDRQGGVAGMIASQVLPFGDAEVMGLWFDVETRVYKALKEAGR